jgi:hypothetical protein
MANVLNTDAVLFQEFRDRRSKSGDKTLTLFAAPRRSRYRCFARRAKWGDPQPVLTVLREFDG